MITPIRIGGLTLNLRQLCYSELTPEGLFLQFTNGYVCLEGKDAETMHRYLEKNSAELSPEPELPELPEQSWMQANKVVGVKQ